MRIRPAELHDAEAIRGIYNPVVETSTATFDLVPRTLEEQVEWLSDRSGARIVLVAAGDDDVVAGYAALSPYRERAAYSTTVEDSVYVHPDHQGRGVGRLLLEALVQTARAHGFHAMMARIVGHEREVGRKFGRWLDVTLMERLL